MENLKEKIEICRYIEKLKKEYNLSPEEIFMLQITVVGCWMFLREIKDKDLMSKPYKVVCLELIKNFHKKNGKNT